MFLEMARTDGTFHFDSIKNQADPKKFFQWYRDTEQPTVLAKQNIIVQ